MVRMREKGMSNKDIARVLEVDYQTVTLANFSKKKFLFINKDVQRIFYPFKKINGRLIGKALNENFEPLIHKKIRVAEKDLLDYGYERKEIQVCPI